MTHLLQPGHDCEAVNRLHAREAQGVRLEKLPARLTRRFRKVHHRIENNLPQKADLDPEAGGQKPESADAHIRENAKETRPIANDGGLLPHAGAYSQRNL